MYLILGEIYDKDIQNNLEILQDFNKNLQYLYPFKVKRNGDTLKVYKQFKDKGMCSRLYYLRINFLKGWITKL